MADVPRCDGVFQEGEGASYDAIFDADKDGFPDGNNTDCQAIYHRLDCDDTNPDIHPDIAEKPCNGVDDDCNPATPDSQDVDADGADSCVDCDDRDGTRTPGAEEICFDGVDNDCDGEIDQACGPNYSGIFVLDAPVAYGCGAQTIQIDFDSAMVTWDPPFLSFLMLGPGVQPGSMDGEFTDDAGAFLLRNWNLGGTAAACEEYYQITGAFLDADHFDATFEIAFVGGIPCLNCTEYKAWTLHGSRQP